jgi:hypothetical protein
MEAKIKGKEERKSQQLKESLSLPKVFRVTQTMIIKERCKDSFHPWKSEFTSTMSGFEYFTLHASYQIVRLYHTACS